MGIVNTLSLESNRQIKINFDGGDFSFDAGYFEDDASDELTNDPVFKSVLEKDALASQLTLQPILDEYLNDYPAIRIPLRGDSGFATPDLYKQCEENGKSYVIRLKENGILREKDPNLQ